MSTIISVRAGSAIADENSNNCNQARSRTIGPETTCDESSAGGIPSPDDAGAWSGRRASRRGAVDGG